MILYNWSFSWVFLRSSSSPANFLKISLNFGMVYTISWPFYVRLVLLFHVLFLLSSFTYILPPIVLTVMHLPPALISCLLFHEYTSTSSLKISFLSHFSSSHLQLLKCHLCDGSSDSEQKNYQKLSSITKVEKSLPFLINGSLFSQFQIKGMKGSKGIYPNIWMSYFYWNLLPSNTAIMSQAFIALQSCIWTDKIKTKNF